MPVGLLGCGDRPGDRAARQALTDMRVFGDVTVVVVVDEGMAVDRIVECQRDDGQKKTHHRIALFSGREQTGPGRVGGSFSFCWQ